MGRSITEGLYTSPLSRTGDRKALSDKEVSKLDDDAVLYSIRGEAPEGWYNAGTRKHASKGSGYEDHQIFKKLPTAEKKEEPTGAVPSEDDAKEVVKDVWPDQDSPALAEAKERAQNWERRDHNIESSPYGSGEYHSSSYSQRGLMDKLQGFNAR